MKLIRSWFTKVLSSNIKRISTNNKAARKVLQPQIQLHYWRDKKAIVLQTNLQTGSMSCQIKTFFLNQQFPQYQKTGHRGLNSPNIMTQINKNNNTNMHRRVYLDVWMPVGRMEEVMFTLSVQDGLYQQLWLKADILQCLDPSKVSHQVHRIHFTEVVITISLFFNRHLLGCQKI